MRYTVRCYPKSRTIDTHEAAIKRKSLNAARLLEVTHVIFMRLHVKCCVEFEAQRQKNVGTTNRPMVMHTDANLL